jgi:hypothetical protein
MNSILDDLDQRLADLATSAPNAMPLTRVTERVAVRRRRRVLARGTGGLIAFVALVGTVMALQAGPDDRSGPATEGIPTSSGQPSAETARNYHLALTAPGWTLTTVEVTTDQVRSTYRNEVGDDATGGPSISITTGVLSPIDRSRFDQASDFVVDAAGLHAVVLRNTDQSGLAFVLLDLGGGRSSQITVELADNQLANILSAIHVIDQAALESLALESGISVQHNSEDPPTVVSAGG